MRKCIQLIIVVTVLVISTFPTQAQITLTHNVGNDLISPSLFFPSCEETEYWARTFTLSEFGVSNDEDFQINSGSIGVRSSIGGNRTYLQFNIYSIDNNFPNSFSEANLIGSSQMEFFPYVFYSNPQIVSLTFDEPVIVPAGVERILVEVKKIRNTDMIGSSSIFITGTEEDNDLSWYKGCGGTFSYVTTGNFVLPRPDVNYYIVVNGEIASNTFNFQHACLGNETEFNLNFDEPIISVHWDFGDGSTSNLENPSHTYDNPGVYDVTTTVYQENISTPQIISKQLEIYQIPSSVTLPDIHACEDSPGSGISSSFNTSAIESEILNGQTNTTLRYFNENGEELQSPLPNLMTNSIPYQETITVRLANSNAAECYVETSFNLIVDELPNANAVADLIACDIDNDGYASFDTTNLQDTILGNQAQVIMEYVRENGEVISGSLPNQLINLEPQQETITARVIHTNSGCFTEVDFHLIVKSTPEANPIKPLVGCDDNNDGISEHFNTENIENEVLNGQTGMLVSYFNQTGETLPTPLPNPYTNTQAFHENITVRVTNEETGCYDETILSLQTSAQPEIQQPSDLYGCDISDGHANFNTSTLENQIIGNQTNLEISFFDSNNNPLPSPLPETIQNTEPYIQTLYVKVENIDNPACYSETSFNLIVNELPQVELNDQYFICGLDPSINLEVNSGYNSYEWYYENGDLIANTSQAEIIEEGNYTLIVSDVQNGLECQNSFSLELIRSEPPQIDHVNYGKPGANFIEIMASGDGDFEYSIDGLNYQSDNYFGDILGGKYTVYVRDKDGCGEDSTTVTLIDYANFFTPNNDGYNDYWQIKGIHHFSYATINIYDRFGKLLVQLPSNTRGWDGYYNGKKMPSNDYWFNAILSNGKSFSGHFTLKR